MQVDLGDLVRSDARPFVRHLVDPRTYDAAWVHGDAVVLHGAAHTVVLGPAADAEPLVAAVAREVEPRRLTVEEQAAPGVRSTWSWDVRGHWHWMRTEVLPPEPDPTATDLGGSAVRVVEGPDDDAVDAVLDVAMPASHARPGTPGIEAWLGLVLTDGSGEPPGERLVGVGAVRRDPDGSGHLRGVCVRPGLAGRGLGSLLSTALTRRAMDRPPHVATLGVYTDNAVALRVYARLGYRTRHTFLSGPTALAAVG